MDKGQSIGPFSLLALAAAVLVSLPLVGGFFGSWYPAFDSMAHFRIHLGVMLVACAVMLVGTRLRAQALTAAALGIAALGTVYGTALIPGLGTVHADSQSRDEAAPVYRLLQINLRFVNAEPEKVLSLIGRLRPDVITAQEVSEFWKGKLDLLKSAYPYRFDCNKRSVIGGVSILSVRPLSAERCVDDGNFAVGTVDIGGRNVDVATIHLPWPWPFNQAEHVGVLATSLRSLPDTALLAGDLNATPWSETVRRIASAGGLTPSGFLGATWQHNALPDSLRFAGLALDQVFSKGDVVIHSTATLEPTGSDHLPILVEFSLRPGEPGATHQTATAALSTTAQPRS